MFSKLAHGHLIYSYYLNHSSQHIKLRFRALKRDLAWLVDASLRHTFFNVKGDGEQQNMGEGEGEGCHGDMDAFVTAVTTILPEKV